MCDEYQLAHQVDALELTVERLELTVNELSNALNETVKSQDTVFKLLFMLLKPQRILKNMAYRTPYSIGKFYASGGDVIFVHDFDDKRENNILITTYGKGGESKASALTVKLNQLITDGKLC